MPAVSARAQRWVGLLLLVTVTLPLAGCKKKPPTPVAVKGRALDAAGKPLTDLLLVFHPQDKENQSQVPSAILKEGHFEVQCLPGRYRVTLGVIPVAGQAPASSGVLVDPGKADNPKQDSIPAPYRNSTNSPWEITISENGKADLELRLQPLHPPAD